jgi:hypothetical protein
MHPIPVPASPEAVDYVTEQLLRGRDLPDTAGLVPGLFAASNQTLYDSAGREVEHYRGTFFEVGWHREDDMAGWPTLVFGLSGLRLRAHPETVRSLDGKRLVLRTVTVGPLTRDRNTRPMLKALSGG